MNIALVILKNGVTLVAQSDELEYEPKCHLTRPMAVSGDKNVVLTVWPKYTDDVDILLRSDDLLTVCEPTERVLERGLVDVRHLLGILARRLRR